MDGNVEGKTKVVIRDPHVPNECDIHSKNIVTWDDTYQFPMAGKAVCSTTTTSNVFTLLAEKGQPVAFLRQTAPETFRAIYCQMIRLEVIVRRYVDEKGSYKARNPKVPAGYRFDEPLVEFFLKTDGPKWGNTPLPAPDPFISYSGESGICVHHPKRALAVLNERGRPVPTIGLFLSASQLGWDEDGTWPFEHIARLAREGFLIVERGFEGVGLHLQDWKGEFGYGPDDQLLHADVYDNDSWRIKDDNGREYSKQIIRNRGVAGIETSKADYRFIAQQSTRMLELALG